MRILLLTNIVPPAVAQASGASKGVTGGWLHTVFDCLASEPSVELGIAMPVNGIIRKHEGCVDGVHYYFFTEGNAKKYSKDVEKQFKIIIDKFKPDIVNVFGTEYPRTLSMIEACTKEKVIITITGAVSIYAQHYYGRVPDRYHFPSPKMFLRPFINMPTLFEGKRDFQNRGKYEVEAIRYANYFVGRTRFDKALINMWNPSARYYSCNETLRDRFYKETWKFEKCKKHTIIVPQAGYPIKGFEVFLDALSIVKKTYPDTTVYVPGRSVFAQKNALKRKILVYASQYDSFIQKKLQQLQLQDSVIFTGLLDEKDLTEQMLSSNVFVLPSAIENSPNTLGEAMLLGMPCISSFVGGVPDLLKDGEEGYLYPYDEPHILAYQIIKVFSEPDKAIEIVSRARIHAMETHNKKENMNNLISIYKQVYGTN